MTETEHQHRWAQDQKLGGIFCIDQSCQTNGWDWALEQMRGLRDGWQNAEAQIRMLNRELAEAQQQRDDMRAALPRKEIPV